MSQPGNDGTESAVAAEDTCPANHGAANDGQAGMFLIGPQMPRPMDVEGHRKQVVRLGLLIVSQGINADPKIMHELAAIIEKFETQ